MYLYSVRIEGEAEQSRVIFIDQLCKIPRPREREFIYFFYYSNSYEAKGKFWNQRHKKFKFNPLKAHSGVSADVIIIKT